MLLAEVATFVRVVEAGSFAAGSRLLGVPKSTLSRAVTRLEDEMRVKLVRRSARPLALTDAGDAFFQRVAPLVADLRDAMATLADVERVPRGALRVTAPAGVGEGVLGELLVRFSTRYPQIQLDVDLSGRVVDLARDGYDVAIRTSTRLPDSSLVARKLARIELRLYASPAYLARRGTPMTVGELAEHDGLLFRPPDARAPWSATGPGAGGDAPRAPRIIANDFHFLRAALRAAGGVGLLPSFLATDDVMAGRLTRVLPEWSRGGGTLYLVYPDNRPLPQKVIAFRDFLVESLRRRGAD